MPVVVAVAHGHPVVAHPAARAGLAVAAQEQ
jgi:hypothetical protein